MNKREQMTVDTWNKVAQLYEDKFMDLDLYNGSYDHFCGLINTGSARILDVGCGPGNITKYLLDNHPGYKIEGVDIAANMIALASKNNPGATFRVMDTRGIHSLGTRYNGIICGFCIPYLSKDDCCKFIGHASRLLLPDGVLYISFVAGDYDHSSYQTGSSGDQLFFYYHSFDFINQELTKHDLDIAAVFEIDYPKRDGTVELHTIVVAKLSRPSASSGVTQPLSW